MGFLKKLFKNVFRDGEPSIGRSSFDTVTDDQLERHMEIARYGDFVLTEAVRPSFDLSVVPQQGYRHDTYFDEATKARVPVLMGAVTKEQLFEVFMELIDPLGSVVDVVLETSHNRTERGHTDLYREHIDMPVLKSILWDFEDLLTNDGCTGIAVLNPGVPQEVQFDEHKLLIVYGQDLSEYEDVLRQSKISCNDSLSFITEAEHVHSSSAYYQQQFEDLKLQLGMDSML
jgi:hypothetical protein